MHPSCARVKGHAGVTGRVTSVTLGCLIARCAGVQVVWPNMDVAEHRRLMQ